jgi:hypothetical protein
MSVHLTIYGAKSFKQYYKVGSYLRENTPQLHYKNLLVALFMEAFSICSDKQMNSTKKCSDEM